LGGNEFFFVLITPIHVSTPISHPRSLAKRNTHFSSTRESPA
jgi:hypothetical protein